MIKRKAIAVLMTVLVAFTAVPFSAAGKQVKSASTSSVPASSATTSAASTISSSTSSVSGKASSVSSSTKTTSSKKTASSSSMASSTTSSSEKMAAKKAVSKTVTSGKTPSSSAPATDNSQTTGLPAPVVNAKSAILVEASTGKVLYQKNAHEKLPPASVTKIMTELLTLEAIDSGKLKWSEELTCSAHASSMGGSDISLAPNEKMSVTDLFKALAISSANDAAVVFAEKIGGSEQGFVAMMNKKARELGMNDTHFVNTNGLDADGHVTSAYDITLMSKELLKHKDIFKFCTVWMDYLRGKKTMLVNTNKLIRTYTGINGLKTGMTGKAGFCISATAKRDGMQLIAVTMGSASIKERNTAASNLLDYGFGGWSLVQPKAVKNKFTINVQSGQEYTVNASVSQMPTVLVTKGNEDSVKQKLSIVTNVAAPVEKGQVIGQITLFADGKNVGTATIKADCAVPKMTFCKAFLKLISYLAS